MRMIEARRGLRLTHQPRTGSRIPAQSRCEKLDRDITRKQRVAAAVDDPRPATSQSLVHREVPDAIAGRHWWWRQCTVHRDFGLGVRLTLRQCRVHDIGVESIEERRCAIMRCDKRFQLAAQLHIRTAGDFDEGRTLM